MQKTVTILIIKIFLPEMFQSLKLATGKISLHLIKTMKRKVIKKINNRKTKVFLIKQRQIQGISNYSYIIEYLSNNKVVIIP